MIARIFTGSISLCRFAIRKDRIWLALWLIGITAFTAGFVPVFENLFTTDAENLVMSQMMKNPAMVAIVGPVYGADNYHTGASYANMMLLFMTIAAGIMNIFFISKHTRQDEELGRLEVIRSLPVGRLANLASALLAALIANISLFLISGLGLYLMRSEDMTFNGCMLFGASMGVIGLFFAASTALFCQLSANNRTATSLSFLFLMLLYLLRAVGDLSSEALSLISPLGLILRTETFVANDWFPIGIIVLITLVIGIAAFYLVGIRDLGRGLVPERPGKRHASVILSNPLGLAARLVKTSALIWSITIFIFAAMYGSIFGELEDFLQNNELLMAIFSDNAQHSMTEQFIPMLISIMSIIGTIPVLSIIHKIHGEERGGYTEHLLGRAVSRTGQFSAYFMLSFILSIFVQLLTALGFWTAGSIVMPSLPSLGVFIQAAFAYLPAIWIMMGVSTMLIAYLPGKTSLSYLYLALAFISVYLGTMANLPEWMLNLTPFGHIPQIPLESFNTSSFISLIIIAVLLWITSIFGYHRRDLYT